MEVTFCGIRSAASRNAMKLNRTVQPTLLITNEVFTLKTQTIIRTRSPAMFGPCGFQMVFHQAALTFAMECDRK